MSSSSESHGTHDLNIALDQSRADSAVSPVRELSDERLREVLRDDLKDRNMSLRAKSDIADALTELLSRRYLDTADGVDGRGVRIYPLMACGECGKPVQPDDETIIGEVPMHKTCANVWADRNADVIAGTASPPSPAEVTEWPPAPDGWLVRRPAYVRRDGRVSVEYCHGTEQPWQVRLSHGNGASHSLSEHDTPAAALAAALQLNKNG